MGHLTARRAALFVMAVVAAVAPVMVGGGATGAAAATTRTYYISEDGSDQNSGTTPGSAWRTLAKLGGVQLRAGDTILLERGSTWKGALRVPQSGTSSDRIVVGAYGTGKRPRLTTGDCVRIEGSWITVSGLRVERCEWAGISVTGDNVRIQDNITTRNVAGVHVATGAENTVVVRNKVLHNRRMSVNTAGGDDDSGAFGVLVNGDRTKVAWNVIRGHHALSQDYGVDGAAVEIYQAIGSRVHHNIARGNKTFTELGGKRSADNAFTYNLVTARMAEAEFLIVPGDESGWGPVNGTVARHNTAFLFGKRSEGFVCYSGCSKQVLTMTANVVVAQAKVGYADGAYAGGNNLYWGGQVQFPLASGDLVRAPQFVDATNRDFRLQSTSPGIDRVGLPDAKVDVLGADLPQDGDGDGVAKTDLGGVES